MNPVLPVKDIQMTSGDSVHQKGTMKIPGGHAKLTENYWSVKFHTHRMWKIN
jgi:hypothetical protein